MATLTIGHSQPDVCSYIPGKTRLMELSQQQLTREELTELVSQGWVMNPKMVLRPVCHGCNACMSLRVKALEFRPNRSQRKVLAANPDINIIVGKPEMNDVRRDLFIRHHTSRAAEKNWSPMDDEKLRLHMDLLTKPTHPYTEWAHYLGDKVVAVCYTIDLVDGYYGYYYYHDPDYRERSLGNWMCLQVIERAKRLGLQHVYMGSYVSTCGSLNYKARFGPNQLRYPDGQWRDFQS